MRYSPSDKIVIHGKRSRLELAHMLGLMDCLVLPSRIDSFGMVVVEALAAGIPTIVTPKVGAAEVITGKNGWIVPVGSAVALSKQMSLCCAEPRLAREMRGDCIASAARHQWVEYRARMLSIIDAVIGLNRQSRDDFQALSSALKQGCDFGSGASVS